MNTWARKSFKVGVLAAGGLLFAGTAANAATINSIGNSGLLTGNQVNATVQAPIDVCGNGVGVLGFGAGGCQGGSWATIGDDNTTLNSVGNSGLGVGNQVNATVQAPIDVCGNGVGVAGAGIAGCQGGSWATIGGGNGGGSNGGGYSYTTATKAKSHAKKATSHVTESTTITSVGNSGALTGNQANAVVQIPIDVCGNAVGVLGAAQASCQGGATASDNGGGSTNMTSGFNAGFLTGNQANALVQIPINVCGNAVGVLGAAQASCQGGATATTGGNGGGGNGGGGNGGGGNGGGNGGYGYGGGMPGGVNESSMAKPAKVSHNMGMSNAGGDACSPTLNSIGNSGLLTGNQLNAVVQAPVEISGNAVGVLGAAFASSQGGAWASC